MFVINMHSFIHCLPDMKSISWLNSKLKQRIVNVFEKKYARQLSEAEINLIAKSLCDLTEIALKVHASKYNEK